MYIFVSCMCPSVSVCEKPETEKKTADCEPGQPPRAVCTLVHGPHGRARRVREVWKVESARRGAASLSGQLPRSCCIAHAGGVRVGRGGGRGGAEPEAGRGARPRALC